MENLKKLIWVLINRDFSNSKEFRMFFFLKALSYSILVLLPSLRHFPITDRSDYFLLVFSWVFITVVSGLIIYFSAMNRWFFALFFPIFIVLTGAMSYYIGAYNLVVNGAVVDSTLYTNNKEAFNQVSFYFRLSSSSFICLMSTFLFFIAHESS
jgi:glucan phosphoethanolaminetransferase (alkaline phosphatase superfamily)